MKHFESAILAVATLLTLVAPGVSRAASSTSNMQVTATVQATCTVASTDLAFGVYTGVQTDQTSTITVTCTTTTPYTIALSAGTFVAATVATRRMTGPATAGLAYTLSRDAARVLNWGETIVTDTVAGIGTGVAQPVTVYGRVAAGQFVTPGAYADTVLVTLTY